MNSYQETLQYLFNLQLIGIKLGLDNVSALLKYLDNPQKKWPAIHVAGTNGKGSTAAFLFSILRQTDLRVGLYTSPHLVDFSERIRVNDQSITWEEIVDYTNQMRPQIDKNNNTFFEATSAIAFQYFADQQVDIAIIETGLGGRLDATNLVEALITVITPIGYDHQQYLGDNIQQIAEEKAGIIKHRVSCVTNNNSPLILEVFQKVCNTMQSKLYLIDPEKAIGNTRISLQGSIFNLKDTDYEFKDLKISLAGGHQITNAALAVHTGIKLETIQLTERQIRDGLRTAHWPARLQIIQENPMVILDVAHNIDGFKNVFNFLKGCLPNHQISTIVGLAKDKDYSKIADLISTNASRVGIVKSFSDRALPSDTLKNALNMSSERIFEFTFIDEAYSTMKDSLAKDEFLLIIGSHYLAGEFLKKYKNIDFK
jgi:dihydrofolate synthase/folylpolyglutamate synthase